MNNSDMAVNFIIQRATGGTINLQNKNLASLSTVTKGTQKIARLGEDIVNISVESAVKVAFHIGDKITMFGRDYRLNRLPVVKKEGKRLFSYDLEFEGVQYDLMRATYDLTIDTTNNELQDVQADTLTGNLERFATVLIANANRVFPGKWVLGGFPANTEDKTLTFAENDNCLSVVQRICSEYNIEFDIEQDGGVSTLHFRKSGQIFPYTFEYGKGKGLYSLERQNISSANIVTRLKVFGSNRNITARYRSQRLCLPGKTKGQSYMEKPAAVVKYGIWEATKYFEDIYPHRAGKVTGLVPGSVVKFVDNTMNFDLNEKETDGVTTKYLLNGVAAKIHFNSGNLSGYEFELQSYDHATKTFTLKPFKDERDDTFPSEKSVAFQFGINDEYKILDIALPQAYIDTAEAELETKGNEYYDQNSQPKVQYALEVAEEFLKSLSGSGSTVNIFSVGDYIPVKDDDIDVDKSVRVQSFTRDLLNEYAYQLTISDTVTTNITNRVISELIDIDKIVKINNLKDPARAKRDWRSAQELLDMMFDVEGDYYSEKIKSSSIETQMLSVGAKSMQFGLIGTIIQANYNGNKNSVNVRGGVLSHYAIEEDGRIWNLADNTTTLTGDSTPYYIYAKCQRVGTAGSIIFSTSQIKVEQDPDFYHFFVGVVNSVDPGLNVRSVALTYGFTTVNGRFVRTGRIQSNDGATYFDLDTGIIGGKIRFLSSGAETDLETWAGNADDGIQEAKDKVDNLQISNRNYLRNSRTDNITGWSSVGGTPSLVTDAKFGSVVQWQRTSGSGEFQKTFTIVEKESLSNTDLVYFVLAKRISETGGFNYGGWPDTNVNPVAGNQIDYGSGWVLYWRTIKSGSTIGSIFGINSITGTWQFYACGIALGNKYGGWRIADEDVQAAAISVAEAKAELARLQAEAYADGIVSDEEERAIADAQAKLTEAKRYASEIGTSVGGKMLHKDPTFKSGTNGATKYNNSGGSTTFWERIAKPSDAPSDSTHIMRYRYEGAPSSPNWGGFAFQNLTRANAVFITKIIAKIPVGKTINWHSNAVGSPGNKIEWLTSRNGTGRYETYLCKVTCGTGGTFSTTNFFSFAGGSGAFNVEVAYATVFDMTLYDDTAEVAKADADAAQSTANSLKNFTDTAFADGIVSRNESAAIEKYKNSLNEVMSKAEASYNKTYVNTYLEGTAKTNLLNAKINLWGQRDTLLSAINTAISGGTTTPAQKTAVDNAFTSFNSLMLAYQNALEDADKAIQAKLDELGTQKVNNLRVGGRNYFSFRRATVYAEYATLKERGDNYIEVTKTATTTLVVIGQSSGSAYPGIGAKRTIITGYFFINGQPVTGFSVNNVNTYKTSEFFSVNPATGFVKCILSATNNGWAIHGTPTLNGVYATAGDVVRIENLMIEVVESGNLNSDFKIADEDIQESINSAKLTAEQAQLAADGYMRARYIRDWAQGNTVNAGNHWSEIKVILKNGNNIAQGKAVTGRRAQHATNTYSRVVDNNLTTYGTPATAPSPPEADWVRIDLGQVYYDIDYIQVWHTIADNRTYFGAKTEISEDGVNWTPVFDSAKSGTYKETAQGNIITFRPSEVLSKVNKAAAIADKLGTTIDGGLIATVMIVLRELNSAYETAGMSGIQGALRNNPAFWAGGTYAQALALIQFLAKMSAGTTPGADEYENLAKITLLHDGAAKVGDFIIEKSGRIVMIDPTSGKPRLMFTVYNLPLIADLMSGTVFSGSTNIGAGSTGTSQVLSGSTVVTKDGATATFNGTTINISASGQKPPSDPYSTVEATLWLRKNGMRWWTLAVVDLVFEEEDSLFKSRQVIASPSTIPLGTYGAYTFELVIVKSGIITGEYATTSSSTFSWQFTEQNVRYQQYGLDGMMFFYSNHHFYFTEGKGLDIRGATNMPGMLLSATVNTNGGFLNSWGAKKHASSTAVRNSAGRYTVYHSVGHTNYQVSASPAVANRSHYIVSRGTTNFIIEWRSIGSSPALIDTAFDFQITGNNYNT